MRTRPIQDRSDTNGIHTYLGKQVAVVGLVNRESEGLTSALPCGSILWAVLCLHRYLAMGVPWRPSLWTLPHSCVHLHKMDVQRFQSFMIVLNTPRKKKKKRQQLLSCDDSPTA
jgi:hypothetical protein